jgi:HAD superfamily hydrolase (TIGR01484 family)
MSQQLLLCTDLDRTLLPNGPQPESPMARMHFADLALQPGVTLAYVTGRHRALVEQAIRFFQLPQPDFVIGDVGSTIYELKDGVWQHWGKWEAKIASDWAGRSREDLKMLFTGLSGLRLQETVKQGRHKLSYYIPIDINHEALISSMYSRLSDAGIKAVLISSIDEPSGVGLLDVLPACATKRHAIDFLMEERGFTLKNTVFAGDSGNDLAVLTSPIQAVLVANATDEIRCSAQQQANVSGHSAALYLAKGGFLEMNGNYSAGILEGVVHYLPEMIDCLRREI